MRGANLLADRSVVVATLDGDFVPSDWPVVRALLDRLLPPGIDANRIDAPPDGLPAAVVAIADQICAWAGFPPERDSVRAIARRPPDAAVLPAGYDVLTIRALELAVALIAAAREGTDEPFLAATLPELIELKATADEHLVTTRRYIARAAERKGLPFLPFNTVPTHVLVGEGRYGRLFDGASTWATSSVAMRLAANKIYANRMLDRAGIPVGRQIPIADLAAARAALARLGLPMIIKPVRSRRQGGVSFVYRAEELDACYAHSTQTSMDLIAESYLPGNEYRALVIAGEVVSLIQHRPANVIGDGRTSVAELIARANGSRTRGPRSHGFTMSPIPWNDLARRFLAWRGLGPDDVPPAGARIETYPLGMMREGGDRQIEVVDTLHPQTRAMLERAVATFGLDVAGVDLRTPDPARDWREIGAGICEVNPQPQIGIHYNVQEANARDVAGILLDRIYPLADRGRMRHVVLAASIDRAPAARAIADALTRHFGWRVATIAGADVDLAGYRPRTPLNSFRRAQVVALEDRTLDAAVHVIHPEYFRRIGLGVSRADLMLVSREIEENPGLGRSVRRTAQHAGARVAPLPADDAEAARVALAALRGEEARRAAE